MSIISEKKILAIETSCDDTSVSLVSSEGFVHYLSSTNQDAEHSPFGGIVPEIACRNHAVRLLPLIDQSLSESKTSWSDIDGIAVTNRPGLIGSLIVGVVTAKTLALAKGKRVIGVNHLEGHILAPFLYDEKVAKPNLEFPYVALAVSGGHTSLYFVTGLGEYSILGATLDDAAGEAFDKFAKTIGLGFPGGVKVDQLSLQGDVKAFAFPRSLIDDDSLQMSFSGLKAAGVRMWDSLDPATRASRIPDLCASYQEAIVDVLIAKLEAAADEFNVKNVVITGGVSANSRLRSRGQQWAARKNKNLFIPPIRFCTDNAAMIGYAGALRLARGEVHNMELGPSPRPWDGDFVTGNMKKGRAARVKRT